MQVIKLDPGTYQPPGASMGEGFQNGMNMVFKARLDQMQGEQDRNAMAALGQLWNQDKQAYDSWAGNRDQAESTAKAFQDHVSSTGVTEPPADPNAGPEAGNAGQPVSFSADDFMKQYDARMPKPNVAKVMQIAKTGSGAFNMAQELYPELFGGSRFYQDADGNITNKPGPGTTLLQPNMARDILKEQNKQVRAGAPHTYVKVPQGGFKKAEDVLGAESTTGSTAPGAGWMRLDEASKMFAAGASSTRASTSAAASQSKATTAAITEARKTSLAEIGVTQSPALEKALGDPNADNKAIMSTVNGPSSLLSLTMAKHLSANPDPGAKQAAETYRKEGLTGAQEDLKGTVANGNFKTGRQLLNAVMQHTDAKTYQGMEDSFVEAQASILNRAADKFTPTKGEDLGAFKQRFYKEAASKGFEVRKLGDTSSIDAALEETYTKGTKG